ncbi:MAG: PQQ-binding-like beta-propeller repeat protein [Limisphaerales bacterium]
MIRRLAGTVVLALAAPALAAEWPAWRGPTGDGWCTETNVPVRWSRTSNVRWRTPLPEPGNSTPVVWRDTVFLTQNIGHKRCLVALSRVTGKERFTKGVDAVGRDRTHATNPHASASPTTDGERVVCWFGTTGVVAFDLQGNLLWRTDLGVQDHQFGYGASPVLHGGLVFLNFGPGPREFVAALDAKTGAEKWRVESKTPGADDIYGTWSTPFLVKHAGQEQLLVALRDYFAALEPATGREIWHSAGLGPQAKTSPVAGGGIALISGDLQSAEIAVQLGGTGDVRASHRLWRETPPRRRVATGVIVDGHCFGARVNGILDCVTMAEGEEAWAERAGGAAANSPVWASPVYVQPAGLVYYVNQGGDTVVVRATPKAFERVEVNSVGETSNASLAISRGQVFLRTHQALWCFEQPELAAR